MQRILNDKIMNVLLKTLLISTVYVVFNICIAKVYFYTDSEGITHFTDSTEDAEEDGYAISEYEDLDEDHEDEVLLSYNSLTQEVMIENQLYSPISVILKVSNESAVETDIKFNEIFTVEANSTQSLGHIYSFDPSADFSLTRQFSIGTPTSIEKSDTGELQIPFRGKFRVSQANGGTYSHRGPKNFYAIDVAMPIGTPIYAARAGKVVDMKMHFTKAGLDPAAHGKANYIRLRHSDGTMTVYVHLNPNSQKVRLGDYVNGGDQIADSGNTGYTSGPHLHFAVQRNNGISTVSIPFKFYGNIEPRIGMWISN